MNCKFSNVYIYNFYILLYIDIWTMIYNNTSKHIYTNISRYIKFVYDR